MIHMLKLSISARIFTYSQVQPGLARYSSSVRQSTTTRSSLIFSRGLREIVGEGVRCEQDRGSPLALDARSPEASLYGPVPACTASFSHTLIDSDHYQ